MKIAIINETSAADKNNDIVHALEGRGHVIINAGMQKTGEKPELLYTHTGLMAAILIGLKKVDFVVGGCGTGQGFLNAVMQYPGIFCGHILTPLDAWLYARINAGNCISLALNQGYGWAGDINLRLIFDNLFTGDWGKGFPEHRKEAQKQSRATLQELSIISHRSLAEIISGLPENILIPVLQYPGMLELIDVDTIQEKQLKDAFIKRL